MPKLRRMTGKEILDVLQSQGFKIVRTRGSHVQLEREEEGQRQRLVVSVHGNEPIPVGTIKAIYRQAAQFIDVDVLYALFYAD